MKNMFNKCKKFLFDEDYKFQILSHYGVFNEMEDKEYLEKLFKSYFGYPLDLENPRTFNEKLQWLKLYDRNPKYTSLVDKYEVRNYIREILGEEYLIPLLYVFSNPGEIDFSKLPNKFVLKCNHNSGLGMCICKSKKNIDINRVNKEIKKGYNQNYYLTGREWPYKDVKRRIIVEQYLEDDESRELIDYKFFCFNGEVDCVMVCIDRQLGEPKFYFFDRLWNLKRYNIRGKNAPEDFSLPKPSCIDEMFKIAELLSKGLPFVRVDLYECGGKVYFGEITFFPQSGFDNNLLYETDLYFGNKINIGENI